MVETASVEADLFGKGMVSTGQPPNFFVALGVGGVVDRVVRPKRSDTLQLFVAPGGDHYSCPGGSHRRRSRRSDRPRRTAGSPGKCRCEGNRPTQRPSRGSSKRRRPGGCGLDRGRQLARANRPARSHPVALSTFGAGRGQRISDSKRPGGGHGRPKLSSTAEKFPQPDAAGNGSSQADVQPPAGRRSDQSTCRGGAILLCGFQTVDAEDWGAAGPAIQAAHREPAARKTSRRG